MFEDTLLLLLWIAGTYLFATIITSAIDNMRFLDSVKENLHKRLDDIVHLVHSEEQGDVTYWYDKDDNEFLAQGKNFSEIATVLKKRYPKHLFFYELDDTNYVISATTDWMPKSVGTETIRIPE